MAQATLTAQLRTDTGKGVARKLRAAGRVPAVMYGHGEQTRNLSLDGHDVYLLFGKVHWENTLIELDVEGEKVKTLVREVQSHAYKNEVLHVDFYQIHADEKLIVEVPIRLVGTPAGIKLGGMLAHTINDLEIRCFPDRIPHHIDIDISHLEIGDAIHVSDLTLPEGVESLMEGDRTVCTVTPPAVVSAADAGGDEGGEPEVITGAKAEE